MRRSPRSCARSAPRWRAARRAGRPGIEGDARSRLAAREAALLSALHGGPPADGLDEAEVQRTAAALAAKRLRGVRRAWPALGHALGAELEQRFGVYARTTPPPAAGAPADGLAFARSLRRAGLRLPAQVRVELALARASVPRRTPFATGVFARDPRRLVIVLARPGGRVRTVALGARQRSWS